MQRVIKNSLVKGLFTIVAFFGFVFTVNAATEYNISYNLNGGSAANPTTYTDEESVTLSSASKSGYTFIGWTGSNGSTPQTSVTIPVGSTGDKSYTANYLKQQVKVIVRALDSSTGNKILPNQVTYYTEGDTFSVVTPTISGYKLTAAPASTSGTVGTADIYLNFYYTETRTLSFDTNGGTSVDKVEREYGSGVQMSDYSSEKDGYTFNGWSSKEDLSNDFTVWRAKSNATAYAKWLLNEYTISYDLDGGTLAEDNPTSYTIESDDITLNNPEKTGYKFIGWTGTDLLSPELNVIIRNGSLGDREYAANYLKFVKLIVRYHDNKGNIIKEELVEEYLEGDTYKATPAEISGYILDETKLPDNAEGTFGNRNVYVDFYYNETRTLSFDTNGGDPIDSVEVEYGTKVDLSNYVPTKEGYDFKGWSTKADLSDDFTVWKGKTTRTIYAKWEATDYTISYDLDGGEATNVDSYTIESDDITLVAPTKEGYTFVGWTGTDLDDLTLVVTIPAGSTGDREYTANYLKNVKLTVNYLDSKGRPVSKKTITKFLEGDYYSVTSKKIDGYKLDRNRLPDNNEGVFGQDDITVYYYYNKLYTLTFESNGGSHIKSQKNLEKGTIITVALYNPTRDGYTFDGWYSNSELTGSRLENVSVREDLTVYAKWIPVVYTITYDLDGGEATNVDSYTIESDDITLVAPVKEGYEFIGWTGSNGDTPELEVVIPTGSMGDLSYVANYLKEVKLIVRYLDNNGNAVSEESITDYLEGDSYRASGAKIVDGYVLNFFKLPRNTRGTFGTDDIYVDYYYNKLCTLTFETNGGSTINPRRNILEGNLVTLVFYNPTRDGYTFGGWYGNADLSGSRLYFVTVNDDMTVYAKWIPVVYTITYDLDGGDAENPDSYTIESDNITLVAPVKEGYKFIGWTGSNGDTPELEVVIPTGSMGDLSYVANYLKEVKLIVRYLDNKGNTLSDEQVIDYLQNDDYEAPAAIVIDGYVLNESRLPENTEGTFDIEDVLVDYYYNKLCTLTFDTNGGLLIPEITDIVEGTDIDLSYILPIKKDNKFISWATDSDLTNLVEIVTVDDNMTVFAKWQFIYKILAGANQTHIKKVDDNLIIVSNGDVAKLTAIEVDGKVISTSSYDVVSGSTILTLAKDYLNSLSVGTHTLRFVYEDGSVSTNFKIDKLAKEAKTVSHKAKAYTSGNPQTGDNIITYVVMLMISMLSLTATSKTVIANKE